MAPQDPVTGRSALPPIPLRSAPTTARPGTWCSTRDLGSLRVPPFVAFVCFTILFVLGLLMLHWRERDEQEAEAAAADATQPDRVPAKV